MPSDPRVIQVAAAMAGPISAFRTVVLSALAQAESFREAQAATTEQRIERARAELGDFSAGRLNAGRFAALFPLRPHTASAGIAALERSIAVLREFAEQGDAAFMVDVPPGGQLGALVQQAFAAMGRILGAATLADTIRAGRYHPGQHDGLLENHDFTSWNRAQRRSSPPLIVSVHGADLHPAVLAPFADGNEKIVLVVQGPSAPAPLARCITPGTLVLQTVDGTGLDRVAACDGPAVAATMPEGAATFLHDPAAGRESWQRLAVTSLGDTPRRGIGGTSSWQMTEDQKLLADLARTPFAIPVAGKAPVPAIGVDDAIDRVAAWLLDQSGLQQP